MQSFSHLEPIDLPQPRWTALANHPRESWGHPGDDHVLIHCSLARLKGTGLSNRMRKQMMHAYREAKYKFNVIAAADIVLNCWSDTVEDLIVDKMLGIDGEPIIVFPHPSFDDDTADGWNAPSKGITNAIPFQMATYLAERIGGVTGTEIVQSARVGRTKLTRECRFLWQPTFEGSVLRGRSYILLDDVITTGGTLAALRSHIARGGGTVIACIALAHGSSTNQKFSIDDQSLNQLETVFGHEIGVFWRETIGHEINCITEAEARLLIRWQRECGERPGAASLQHLRDRLATASATGGGEAC